VAVVVAASRGAAVVPSWSHPATALQVE